MAERYVADIEQSTVDRGHVGRVTYGGMTDEPQPDRRRTAAAIRARKVYARRRRIAQAEAVLRDAGYRLTPPPASTPKETR